MPIPVPHPGFAAPEYDVLVIGGGHAGTEAARAASAALRASGDGRARVALITMDPSRIGQMSCNPAIGGIGKGQIVREIDALGGLMGRAIDTAGIMFKMLNTSKGPAVRGPRAQADKYAYACAVQHLLAGEPDIDVIAGRVDELIVDDDGRIAGVRLPAGSGRVHPSAAVLSAGISADWRPTPPFPPTPATGDAAIQDIVLLAPCVVLTTGTFMRGLMHIGHEKTAGGRVEEAAAEGISAALRGLGFELGRLKTGTPPRIDAATVDWDGLESQSADADPVPFSDMSPDELPAGRFPHLPSVECRITATNAAIHDIVRENLHLAPMYSGQTDAECGPRYCPSIEDKIVRFADRTSHHVFLEPESLYTGEVYCNGISTSLPAPLQDQMVRALPGCERARVLRHGYAVEYDMVWPHQIDATGHTRLVPGLFLAGQINCTTGYEEAGGQGLIAGLNAARRVRGEEPVSIARHEGYIGVMMDDLVTKPPREPYRMFTSRAEHRLRLRADNADVRLTPIGVRVGLVGGDQRRRFETRLALRRDLQAAFGRVRIDHTPMDAWMRRPETTTADVVERLGASGDARAAELAASAPIRLVEAELTETRYAGLISRQDAEVRRQSDLDRRKIPGWLEPNAVSGLRSEAVETLARFRPTTLGQASRLPGVNPADVSLLAVAIRRGRADADTEVVEPGLHPPRG
ncbi:MAG: tRNA uridine-5-carboxymethylaminomethyl(34) synthesis enzyme MnmG [Phycisphaerales bacterium]